MNRGWIVGGALVLVAAPAAPAAAAGVTMVLDRVDDSAGLRTWAGAGDVLRYRVRFEGTARDARLAVATTPVHALTGLTCTPPSQARHLTDPQASPTRQPLATQNAVEPLASPARTSTAAQGLDAEGDGYPASSPPSSELSEAASPEGIAGGPSDGVSAAGALAARTLAEMEASGASTAVVPGAQACELGDLSGRRAVNVVLTVPEGTGEVALAAVARLRQGARLTTMTEATGVPVRATEPDGAVSFSGDAADSQARTDKPRPVRQRDAEAVRTTRRQIREPGMAKTRRSEAQGMNEATRQPEDSRPAEVTRQSVGSGPVEVTRQPGTPETAEIAQQSGNPAEASTKQRKRDNAGVVRQSGKSGKVERAGELQKAEDVQQGRQVDGAEGLHRGGEGVRPGEPGGGGVRPGELDGEGVRPGELDGGGVRAPGVRSGVDVGLAGDLRREPVLGAAAAGKQEKAAELPPAVVPTAAAAPSVTGVSMDVPGAPLPRAVAAPQVRLQAAEVVNPLAGGRGLSAAAGGIAVLMAGLWAISRAHRARTRRKGL